MNKYLKKVLMFASILVIGLIFTVNGENSVQAKGAQTAVISSASYANVYKGPGKNFGLTGQRVGQGELVTSYESSNGWIYVKANNSSGWVWGEYVLASSGYGILSNSWANLYKGAGSATGTNGRIEQGTTVVTFESKNGWRHIYANGQDSWVWGEFVSSINGVATISSSHANLYKGAGKAFGTKGSLAKGTTVAFSGLKNGWRQVYVNGEAAWVWDENLAKSNFALSGEGRITNPSHVNVYHSSGKNNGIKGTISNGEAVLMLQVAGGWTYVQSPKLEGWIWGTYTDHAGSTGKIGNTTFANIYNGAAGNSGTKGRVSAGESVAVYEKQNGWIRIKSGDVTGWIWGEFVNGELIAEPNSNGTKPLTANVNVYKSAGKSHGTIGSLPKDSVVNYYQGHNGWRYIQTESIQGWVWDEYINTFLTLDLLKPSNVTAEEINRYIKDYESRTGKKSIIAGKGQAFINAGNKYGVNAHFLAALTIHESAFGTSNLSYGKFNLFGLKAFDSAPFDAALRFQTVDEGIEYEAAYVRYSYLVPSAPYYNGVHLGDKQSGMNVKYSTDPLWGEKIANHMKNMRAFDSAHYQKVESINSISYSMPDVPENKDVYPSNIQVTAKQQLNLYGSKKGARTGNIPKGKSFELVEKHNDFWLKIKYEGKDYWTFFSFSYFKDYIQVHNLARVEVANNTNTDMKNEAKSSAQTNESLTNNSYVELVLDSKNNPVSDQSNKWYQVKSSKGNTGWIEQSKIKRVYH
ncbi:SH3 domain-containing protein [Cytobacillus purgationiresistens]|uniref:Beta-N-acetylglucosaminidase n=1 Tax=Cytobacillus purgationiresistens TaxID=863449 RepID=A0ABU0AE32_9BACI|nr:SH3 domain-containing protein [Cytobacillus purgationiresistens]MDQ0269134.1 beta-N-acetylglucosaminidase [Cytobacillus purgationiresistens]